MSTAELKEIIDRRTPEERKWMAVYLLDEMFSVPELRQAAQELFELAQRRGDLLTGRSRISEAEAEHWNKTDSERELTAGSSDAISKPSTRPMAFGLPRYEIFTGCCGDWSTIHGNNPTRIFGLQPIALIS